MRLTDAELAALRAAAEAAELTAAEWARRRLLAELHVEKDVARGPKPRSR